MSDFDKFTQPDLVIVIDMITNNNYKASIRQPTQTRPRDLPLTSDITFDKIAGDVVLLRAELTRWARKYDGFLDPNKNDGLSCAPELVRPLWEYLANWGRDMYMTLFNVQKSTSQLARLAEVIRGFKDDAQILIDAPRLVIPWGLLYDGELPAADDPRYVEKCLKHFWGFKYQLELQPPNTSGDEDDSSYINLSPYLDNTDNTRLTVSINQRSDLDYKTGQMEFFNTLGQRFRFSSNPAAPPSLAINNCRETVIKSMMKRQEPQHLLYFYCHQAKGEGVTSEYGSKDYKELTRLMMDGEKEGIIYLKELKKLTQDNAILNFKYPPLIFLNACDSGQLEMGDPSGFMEYFIKDLRSVDYVGTEANVPASFADAYGKGFVEQFLQAKSVGKILLGLNRHYAGEHNNPFGLYYTLFGLSEIRLHKGLEEVR